MNCVSIFHRAAVVAPVGLKQLFGVSSKQFVFVERRRLLATKTTLADVARLRRGDWAINSRRNVGQINNNPSTKNLGESTQQPKLSIFKRFKEAYKQHGKVLIYCHLINCSGWMVGLFFLAKGGFDITSLFNVLEKIHVMSHETSLSIEHKINTFSLEDLLRSFHFDYVLPDSAINWLDQSITGLTLKHMLTAIMLYKIFTPLRYASTLGFSNIAINVLKKRGFVPVKPPPGSSLPELIKEQQTVVSQNLKAQRERYARMRRQQNKKLSLFRGDMRNRMKSAIAKSTGQKPPTP